MNDVTPFLYIAILAFYFLHKNEEGKILVPIVAFAAIPLFSNDYWLWFKVSIGLSIYVLMRNQRGQVLTSDIYEKSKGSSLDFRHLRSRFIVYSLLSESLCLGRCE